MTKSRLTRKTRFWIAVLLAIPFFLIAAVVVIDRIPLPAAQPPSHLKTIEDFQKWKRGEIIGRGTFESSGTTYTVMLAPAGRYLASGPSAYLFNQSGEFVDWTADMGDFYTKQKRFDLTSGNVKKIELFNR